MIIKPPHPVKKSHRQNRFALFLAGSIEMGVAEDWQSRVEKALNGPRMLILNPRRNDWDASWKQEKENAQFAEQVTWELKEQEEADSILMYFVPNTKSPITLLELGLFAHKDMTVCCPEGFWRKGNVDIVCARYGIRQVDTLEKAIDFYKKVSDVNKEFYKTKKDLYDRQARNKA